MSKILCQFLFILLTFPADTDVLKTSSGRVKKVTTSHDQTRRRHDVWKKTSDLRRLEDVLKTSDLRHFETSNLGRLKNI